MSSCSGLEHMLTERKTLPVVLHFGFAICLALDLRIYPDLCSLCISSATRGPCVRVRAIVVRGARDS